jgi:CheY-like chemotaxis protein
MMGGEIHAESAPGKGSTFSFSARFEVPRGAPESVRSELLSLEGARVLIVDDNATNRAILEATTRAKRMRPEGVSSAPEAFLRLVEQREAGDPYQLVLSDVRMPDEDGYSLAERIRGDPRLSGVEIIFLTSAGETGDLGRCRELGIAARLLKPVKQNELCQVMARSLSRGAGRTLSVRALRQAAIGHAIGGSEVAPLRILLVEDSPANRKVACAMLANQGHQIAVAENGREALEKLAEGEYDVVLMDVQMPEMDGFETTAALRAREQGSGRHLPVIAMTAYALQGDREKCLAAGMDDYVPKPLRRDDLFAALSRAAAAAGRS